MRWMILDGPVDTLWIESMNTVLDDNKILTLLNGDRISLPEEVKLIFEVTNLENASPATVSRCGMVYYDTKELGWKPYIESWINKKQQDEDFNDFMYELVDSLLIPILEVKDRECKDLVPCLET
jgi:dynein heavy chain